MIDRVRWVLLVCAACATRAVPPANEPAVEPASAPSSPTPSTTPSRPSSSSNRSIATLLPAYAAPRLVDATAKRVRAVAGSVRVELAPTGTTVADDLFVEPIVAAMPTADGWVFASADGAFARSDTFLGPLVALGEGPRAAASRIPVASTCGRLARGFGDAILSTTGAAVETAPAPGLVREVAFADADFGGVELEGGALFVTHDGGKTFAATDLVVHDLRCEAGKLRADTLEGSILIAADGTRDTATGPVSTILDQDLRVAVRRNVLRIWPELATTAAVWTEPREHDCRPSAWGHEAALTCGEVVYRIVRGEKERALDAAPAPTFSDDGVHAMWTCANDDKRARTRTLETCASDGSNVIRRPHSHWARLVHGSLGLSVEVSSVEAFDIMTGGMAWTIPVTQPSDPRPLAPVMSGEALSGDGQFLVALRVLVDLKADLVTPTHAMLVNLADHAITWVALPVGARAVGFIDRQRGIAVGDDLTTIWQTDDGQTWVPVRLPVPSVAPGRDRTIACAGSRCTIDARVVVDLAAKLDARHLLGATTPSAAPNARRDRKVACTGTPPQHGTPDAGKLAWSGDDRAGAYRAVAIDASPLTGYVDYDVVLQARTGTLLARNTGRADDHVWYPAGGRSVVLDERAFTDTWIVSDAIERPEGGAIAIGIERNHAYHAMFLIDRAGKIIGTHRLAWQMDGDTEVLAAYLDGPGAMVVGRHGSPRVFVGFDGSARAIPDTATLPACTNATSAPVATLAGAWAHEPGAWWLRRVYVRDVVSPTACISAIGLQVPYVRGDRITLPATAGRFAGKMMTCTMEAP